MPRKQGQLIGQKFARLLVIAEADRNPKGGTRWLCRCDCGNEKVYRARSLKSGGTRSCGCYAREVHSAAATRTKFVHGLSHTKIHQRWAAMLNRCTNPHAPNYANYGGRGIKVCDRWLEFLNFLADVGQPPPGKSLDRKDTNGDYEPGNVRWSTPQEQARNIRTNRIIEHGGERKTQAEWAEISGLPRGVIASRLKAGWTTERIFATPLRVTDRLVP